MAKPLVFALVSYYWAVGVDWDSPKSRAAEVKLPCSATATKALS